MSNGNKTVMLTPIAVLLPVYQANGFQISISYNLHNKSIIYLDPYMRTSDFIGTAGLILGLRPAN